jgi:hypothetical protein
MNNSKGEGKTMINPEKRVVCLRFEMGNIMKEQF